MSQEMRERVMKVIRNHALVYRIQMPAAPRGRADNAPTYLPASESFVTVHHEYCEAQMEGEQRVSHSTFKQTWHVHNPDVTIMTPRQDVCARRESFRNRLRKPVTEYDKKQRTEEWLQHINHAESEREQYNTGIEKAKSLYTPQL